MYIKQLYTSCLSEAAYYIESDGEAAIIDPLRDIDVYLELAKERKTVLSETGVTFEHVVKTTIFLSDMNLFATVNEIYGSYFSGDYPARETVAVKGLPKNVNVEISMTAVVHL